MSRHKSRAAGELLSPHNCKARAWPAKLATGSPALSETPRMKKKVTGKDLTKEAPRRPRIRVSGYAILGRTIDKCRALVAGNIGEYHFDCPLDNTLFGFKGVKGDDFKAQIEQGASDQEMVEWLNRNGEKKTPEEIEHWAGEVEASSIYNPPEKEKRDHCSEEV